jgi:hypothetical protein
MDNQALLKGFSSRRQGHVLRWPASSRFRERSLPRDTGDTKSVSQRYRDDTVLA